MKTAGRDATLILGLGCALASACRSEEFRCLEHAQCGAGGTCEPSGYCSFYDPSCDSEARYGQHSGALSGECVEPHGADTAAGDGSVSDDASDGASGAASTAGVSAGSEGASTVAADEGTSAADSDATNTTDPTDPTTGGGVVLPCEADPNVLGCDDFEDADTPWIDSEVAVTTAQAHSGRSSGHVIAVPGGSQRVSLEFPPLTSGVLAVRSWVYLPPSFSVSEWAILYEIMQLPAAPDMRTSVDFQNGTDLNIVEPLSAGAGSFIDANLPPEQWVCIEIRISLADAPSGSYEVLVDDEVSATVSGVDTLPDLGFSLVNVGLLSSELNPATYELYLDDVVISTAPIGCAL